MSGAIIPPKWTELARCASVDPELWFPEKGGTAREAKKICATCEVSAECLQYALDNNDRFGVYGGKSGKQRLKMPQRKRCEQCGETFTPPTPHTRMCSDECRRTAAYARETESRLRSTGRAAA